MVSSSNDDCSAFPLAIPAHRRQLARPIRPSFASSTAAAMRNSSSGGVSNQPSSNAVPTKPASDVLAGALARAASQSTIHPLDTMKVRLQAGKDVMKAPKNLRIVGLHQQPAAVVAWVSSAGRSFASLYRGVVGAASGAGIAIGAYFAFYGVASNMICSYSDMPSGAVAFVAGGIAAAGGSVVKVPLAVCIRSVQAGVYTNVFQAATTIVSAAGVRGLFTGYLPTLLEDVPDMAVKFAVYETLRSLHVSMHGESPGAQQDFCMGATAGALAAATTTPLDVIKTRMMCSAASRPTMTRAALGVWQEAGLLGFFKGVLPRALSNGINSAVFFCFFESIRGVLANRAEAQVDHVVQPLGIFETANSKDSHNKCAGTRVAV